MLNDFNRKIENVFDFYLQNLNYYDTIMKTFVTTTQKIKIIEWKVIVMTIKDIREFTGLNQDKFCEKYKIPKSTFSKWECEVSNPPEYVKELLERVVLEDFKEHDF